MLKRTSALIMTSLLLSPFASAASPQRKRPLRNAMIRTSLAVKNGPAIRRQKRRATIDAHTTSEFDHRILQAHQALSALGAEKKVLVGNTSNFHRLPAEHVDIIADAIGGLAERTLNFAPSEHLEHEGGVEADPTFASKMSDPEIAHAQAEARRMVDWIRQGLKGSNVHIGDAALNEIVEHPEIAARAMQASGLSTEQFLGRYRTFTATLKRAQKTHQVIMHMPGQNRGKLGLVAREIGVDKPIAIEVPLRVQNDVLEAVTGLQTLFGHTVRPWMEGLMEGSPEQRTAYAAKLKRATRTILAEKQQKLETTLAQAKVALAELKAEAIDANLDPEGAEVAAEQKAHLNAILTTGPAHLQALRDGTVERDFAARIDSLLNFRDNSSVHIVGLSAGDIENSPTAQAAIESIKTKVAKDIALNHFYDQASAKEGSFGVLAKNLRIAYGLEIGARLSEHVVHNEAVTSMVHLAIPVAVDLFDEFYNALLNGRENKKNIMRMPPGPERTRLLKQNNTDMRNAVLVGGAMAMGFAALPWEFAGGQSALQIAQDPSQPAHLRGVAGALYGLATSGGGLYMAYFGGKRFETGLQTLARFDLVKPQGNGFSRRHWYAAEGRKELRGYPAQKGSLWGAAVSMGLGFGAGYSGILAAKSHGEEIGIGRAAGRLGAFAVIGGGEGITSATYQHTVGWKKTTKIKSQIASILR